MSDDAGRVQVMAAGAYSPQQAGRLGGLIRAATAPTRQDITRAANAARWRKYVDQVTAAVPGLTDQAELMRRAELLMRADMVRLSARASDARKRRAKMRRQADVRAADAE